MGLLNQIQQMLYHLHILFWHESISHLLLVEAYSEVLLIVYSSYKSDEYVFNVIYIPLSFAFQTFHIIICDELKSNERSNFKQNI